MIDLPTTPPAPNEHCPAAKHHRVISHRKGGIEKWTEDGPEYAADTLTSDKCVACGYDFGLRERSDGGTA